MFLISLNSNEFDFYFLSIACWFCLFFWNLSHFNLHHCYLWFFFSSLLDFKFLEPIYILFFLVNPTIQFLSIVGAQLICLSTSMNDQKKSHTIIASREQSNITACEAERGYQVHIPKYLESVCCSGASLRHLIATIVLCSDTSIAWGMWIKDKYSFCLIILGLWSFIGLWNYFFKWIFLGIFTPHFWFNYRYPAFWKSALWHFAFTKDFF